jgi:hypothetical protein
MVIANPASVQRLVRSTCLAQGWEGALAGKKPDVANQDQSSKLGAFSTFISALVPLLWVALASVAFYFLFPLAKETIQSGSINKIKLGIVEIELAHVAVTAPDRSIDIAKDAVLIDPQIRKQITDRFAAMAEKTKGATILWVDDNHPYQNVAERRVFIAAGITVDLARTTSEAMQWLYRSNYDVLITDSNRSAINDPGDRCYPAIPQPANAGCALLKKVGSCFELNSNDQECTSLRARPNVKKPTMIVYSGDYHPELGTPAFAAGLTNRADHLINLVLDALDKKQLPLKADKVAG